MQTTATTTVRNRARRGNTIVLVTAILVLLVIIATAFVGRTRAVRQTSAAQQAAAGRDGRAESIGVNVAQEIAAALFAKPVDTNDPFARSDNSVTPPVTVASSSWPRLPSPLDATRYSIDRDVLPPPSGTNPVRGDGQPDFGYNFAPYEVRAWTNWPDFFNGANNWPFGAGSPGGKLVDANNRAIGDANPYGNPGMGDSRWLRSTEPERFGVDQTGDGIPDLFTFSHWSHLSWLPSANNGWRVVVDISDLGSGTLTNLNENDTSLSFATAVPYEQWLPGVTPLWTTQQITQPPNVQGSFLWRRNNWFGPFNGAQNYSTLYANAQLALPNFIRLRDLGTPLDEFVPNTGRNIVSRTFTDTDGDGFTDSFWFLAPVSIDRSIRTIVGVSVVDNSGLLNANVATKFSFDTTTGLTPSDLALVTSWEEIRPNQNNGSTVGFFDGPMNQPGTNPAGIAYSNQNRSPLPTYWTGTPQMSFPSSLARYDRSRYGDPTQVNVQPQPAQFIKPLTQLQAIGMLTPTGFPDPGDPTLGLDLVDQTLPTGANGIPQGAFESASERLAWFKFMSRDTEQPRSSLTPFDASDEFELRAFHGNNYPAVLSRFEQAVSLFSPLYQGEDAPSFQFLRATPQREENDEYLDQLDARQLLVDNRRKLTMFNGARNEAMPPWMRVTPYYEETFNYMNPDGNIPPSTDPNYNLFQQSNFNEWKRQQLKVDLRRPTFVDANGNPAANRDEFAAFLWRRDLTRVLEKTLTAQATDAAGATTYTSYLDAENVNPRRAFERTRSMIASYVANLDCASDEARPKTLVLPAPIGTVKYADDDPLEPRAPVVDPQGYMPPLSRAVQDPNSTQRFYLGMEKQPFIMEVFFGVVYPKSNFDETEWQNLGGTPPAQGLEVLPPDVADGGENFVDDSTTAQPVIAVQIANPYDTPICLRDFRISFFGKEFSIGSSTLWGPTVINPDGPVLPPATLGRPSTAIIYFAPTALGAASNFEQLFLDFIDVERGEVSSIGGALQNADLDNDGVIEYTGPWHSLGGTQANPVDPYDRTLVFRASNWGEPMGTANTAGFGGRFRGTGEKSVQLLRVVGDPPTPGDPTAVQTKIIVDRFENEETDNDSSFADDMQRLFDDPQLMPPPKAYNRHGTPSVAGIRLGNNEFFMTWCRSSRVWAFDVDGWQTNSFATQRISATELSPRYVFSKTTKPMLPDRTITGQRPAGAIANFQGDMFASTTDPDRIYAGAKPARWPRTDFFDCFNRPLYGKPVFFTNILVVKENQSAVRPEVTYEFGNNPVPFVGDGINQRGTVDFAGETFNWVVGSKGMTSIGGGSLVSDWQSFANTPVMNIPFQMTQKDTDFEQIGEILDVFLWGHVFEGWGGNPTTVRTFSETMLDRDPDSDFYPGEGPLVNRLWIRPPGERGANDLGTPVIGSRFDAASTTNPPTPIGGHVAYRPALPMGVALFDALTVDGPGRNSFDRNLNGAYDGFDPNNALTDAALAEARSPALANRFGGGKTPGLVNLNTAIPEVMQAMPLLTRTNKSASGSAPYSHLVDMIRSYRDRVLLGAPTPFPTNQLPTYADRGLTATQATNSGIGSTLPPNLPRFFPTMRGDRGFSSIGELTLINRFAADAVPAGLAGSYSWRWLGFDPWADYAQGSFADYTTGYSWSTDRTQPRARQLPPDIPPALDPDPTHAALVKVMDKPLGDAEDLNQLFKGISNLVTTRSDVFTVYLRVRQVKQNDVTGVWDGTNREQIVDDARYVMCVDRSNCDSPDDQPRILYFQRCP